MVKHLGETTSLPSTGPWRETSASTGKISTQICVRHIPRTNSPDKNWRRRHENDWKSKMGTNPFPGIQTFRSFDGFWCKLPENIAADRLMVGRPLFPFWGPGCQSPPEIFTFLVIYIYIYPKFLSSHLDSKENNPWHRSTYLHPPQLTIYTTMEK